MTVSNSTAPDPEKKDSAYASVRVETCIDMNADDFFAWYLQEPLENFMLGTMIVPPITGSTVLSGPQWGKAGSSRKIFFKDGTTSLERIIETNLPHSYHYQPWAYTNPVRLISDYAVSTMHAVPEGNKTRIIWDYGFHARHRLVKPLLQLFVTLDWKRNLANGLKVIKAHLETHGTSRRIR